MERINVFLAKHLWAQIALSVLTASVLITLLYPGRSFPSVVVRTAVISLGGIAVALVARRREKRAAGGTTDGLVSLDRKLRTGEVPSDPQERAAMRDLVGQRLHRSRHRVAALVFLAALFSAITVLTALTAGPRQTIGMAVLTVAFIGWMAYNSNLQTRRLRTMRAALQTEPSGGTTSAESEARRPPRPAESGS
ncbi:hypothetical protein ACF1AB_23755 [Streptomyces sp. NPDC014846]|jgi:Flp pilus assembly protein TadB|uniref:hypothetical protein n=1 Tax=Streptomyces sp. NPDC014846 TaxID=3364922 RepID=UPI0037028343